ncbi:hypothetical protein Ocin01_12864 [Orchesella cincta]|uniref:Uncharacterized protein n=1 Tax=Orchesella cincta TaxID=48709 RepID=A0A1D2MLF1_ORCCI|nr:hypothetical protein Ocin01_12864 [Orchesella cincta]
MQILISMFLVACSATLLVVGLPTGEYPVESDSYAIAPKLDQSDESAFLELTEMVPPSADAGPHIYYMNQDGIAEPAGRSMKVLVKREVAPASHNDESMLTDETVIIGPPSGNRPFGTPAIHLGYRPAHAYYARRYHKYPWNYH